MIQRCCGNCLHFHEHFYAPVPASAGTCKRYPQQMTKNREDVCGEFKSAKKPSVQRG